jgi:hypothetical protein
MLRSLVSIVIFGLLTGVANAQASRPSWPPTGSRDCGERGMIQYWNIFQFGKPPASYAWYLRDYARPGEDLPIITPVQVLRSNSQSVVRIGQCPTRGVVTQFSGGGIFYSPNCYNIGYVGRGSYTRRMNRWETSCPAPPRRR